MGYELYRRKADVPASLRPQEVGTQRYADRYLDLENGWQRSGTTFAIILQALEGFGGLYVSTQGPRPDRSYPRDPAGRVAVQLFNSNDGWYVTPSQATYLADVVDRILEHQSVEFLEIDVQAWDGRNPNPPRVPVDIDIGPGSDMRGAFESFRDLCHSSPHGFEVW